MARKKKLNKRLVILLSAFGVVLLAGMMALALDLWPKDPETHAAKYRAEYEQAQAAIERGDYEAALTHLKEADREVRAAIRAGEDNPEYPYDGARIHKTWALEVPTLSEVDRRGHIGEYRRMLDLSLQRDPNYTPARTDLVELLWNISMGQNAEWESFIEEADRLLEMVKEDATTHRRRGYAHARLAERHDSREHRQQATKDFQTATEIGPKEEANWRFRLQFLAKQRDAGRVDWTRVDRVFQEALRHIPDSPALRAIYGDFLGREAFALSIGEDVTEEQREQAEELRSRAQEQYAEAVLDADAAAAAARRGREAYESALAALEAEDYDKAEKLLTEASARYEEAVANDRGNADYNYQLAQVAIAMASRLPDLPPEVRRARGSRYPELLRRSLRRDPEHIEAREGLLEFYWMQARRTNAKASWDLFFSQAETMLAIAPHARTHYMRGLAYSQLSAVRDSREYRDRAREEFRKATELEPDNVDYWRSRVAFLRQHFTDAAGPVCQAGLKHNPESVRLHLMYGEHLNQQARTTLADPEATEERKDLAERQKKAAMQHFKKAVALGEDTVLPFLALGQYYLSEGELEKAEEALVEARKRDPENWRVPRGLAVVHDRQEDTSATVACLRDALELVEEPGHRREVLLALMPVLTELAGENPEQREALLAEAREYADEIGELGDAGVAAYAKAQAALAAGDSAEAERVLSEVVDRGEALDGRGLMLLVNLYYRTAPGKAERLLAERMRPLPGVLAYRALLRIRAHDYEEALGLLNEALEKDPDHEMASRLRPVVLALRSDPPRVPAGLEFGQTERGVLLEAYMSRASQLWDDGQRPETVELLEQLHEKFPAERRVISFLVACYRQIDRDDEAQAFIERLSAAHAEDPGMTAWLASLSASDDEERFEVSMAAAGKAETPLEREIQQARVCARFGKSEQFEEHLARAVEIAPTDPRIIELKINYALAKDPPDLETARTWVGRAREQDADGAGGRFFAARLAAAEGDYATAADALREALAARPGQRRWRLLLAEYTRRRGDVSAVERLERAEQILRDAVASDPGHTVAVIELARLLAQRGKLDEFQKWVVQAHRLAPNHPEVESWKLVVDETEAEDDALQPYIRQRREMLPPEGEEWNESDVRNASRLARLYERAGRMAAAETYYELAYKRGSDKLSGARMVGRFYVRQGRPERLDSLFQPLLDSAADKAEKSRRWLLYGELLAADRPDEAMRAYNLALETDPDNGRAYRAKAALLFDGDQPGEAEAVLTRCLERLPDHLPARAQRGRYRAQSGDLPGARRDFEAVLEANPDAPEPLRLLADVAYEQGEPEAAKAYLNRRLETHPDDAEFCLAMSRILRMEGETGKARQVLGRATVDSTSPAQLTRFASQWRALGELSRAEQLYRSALTKGREDEAYEPALRGLLELYMLQEDWDRLTPLLARAHRLYPEEVYYWAREADMYGAQGLRREQFAALKKAYEIAPTELRVVGPLVMTLLEVDRPDQALKVARAYQREVGMAPLLEACRARAMHMQGQTGEADKLFLSLVEDTPEQDLANVLAQMRAAYGMAQAAEKLSDWLDRRPDSVNLRLVLSTWRLGTGKTEAALRVLKDIEDTEMSDAERGSLHHQLGSIYYGMKDYDRARRHYEISLDAAPKHAGSRNNLAYLISDTQTDPGQLAQAIEYARRARDARPDDGNIRDTYAWLLAGQGRYEKARAELEHALEAESENPVIYYHLGIVYEELGEYAKARAQLNMAKEFGPDGDLNPKIEKALRRVEDALSRGSDET